VGNGLMWVRFVLYVSATGSRHCRLGLACSSRNHKQMKYFQLWN